MTNKKIVVTTTGSPEEARKIANALLDRRLAACVNVLPTMESVYRWQGKVESAQEWLLLIKTDEASTAKVHDLIVGMHSYELPEVIEIAIDGGSPAYLRWIEESLQR
jgi:periplasmic divalent cation tolerance protein